MKKLFLLTLLPIVSAIGQTPTKWEVDASHTNVMFTVTHLVISEVTGFFKSFTANITHTKSDYSDAKGEMTIQVASINTDNERRDTHLKSDDFFAADTYPTITFVSKSFTKKADGKYVITGDLTMRGTTKTVDLDAEFRGEIKDPWGNTKSAWRVTGVVNRLEFGLKWNSLMEAGGAVVDKDVRITVQAEFQKKS